MPKTDNLLSYPKRFQSVKFLPEGNWSDRKIKESLVRLQDEAEGILDKDSVEAMPISN